MFSGPDQLMAEVNGMIDSIWLASAMTSILDRGAVGPFDPDDPAARVLTRFGFLEQRGNELLAPPAVAAVVGDRARTFAQALRSTLGQAATAAFSQGTTAAWDDFGDDILIAQGSASEMFGPGLATFVMPALDGLTQRFAEGGCMLDVGVGVAGLACAFCEAVPTATVVGLDPLPRAIDLASKTVAERGLEDRIELRCRGVEDLDEQNRFDLAWLPLPFIARSVVPESLARIFDALKPGGWLMLAGPVYEASDRGEIARWQAHLAGGTILEEEERKAWLLAAGFEGLTQLVVPPGVPPVFAAKRPV